MNFFPEYQTTVLIVAAAIIVLLSLLDILVRRRGSFFPRLIRRVRRLEQNTRERIIHFGGLILFGVFLLAISFWIASLSEFGKQNPGLLFSVVAAIATFAGVWLTLKHLRELSHPIDSFYDLLDMIIRDIGSMHREVNHALEERQIPCLQEFFLYARTCALGNISEHDRFDDFRRLFMDIRNSEYFDVRVITLPPDQMHTFHKLMAVDTEDNENGNLAEKYSREAAEIVRGMRLSRRKEVTNIFTTFVVVTSLHAYTFSIRRIAGTGYHHEARGQQIRRKYEKRLVRESFVDFWKEHRDPTPEIPDNFPSARDQDNSQAEFDGEPRETRG